MNETDAVGDRAQARMEGRPRRARWITETRREAVATTSASLYGLIDAEGAYVDGHYLASFLAATATIDRLLRDHRADESTRSDGGAETAPEEPHRAGFGDLAASVRAASALSPDAADRLARVRELRTLEADSQPPDADSWPERAASAPADAVLQRAFDADEDPDARLQDHAELALRCLYDVVELADGVGEAPGTD